MDKRYTLSMKQCTKCKDNKELTEFTKNSSTKDKLHFWCKTCSRKSSKEWGDKNWKNKALKRLYGITIEQYQELLIKQSGQCAICSTDKCKTGYALSVDHCHDTGKIRGLLCFSCNTGIGKLDSIDLLSKAINYLS